MFFSIRSRILVFYLLLILVVMMGIGIFVTQYFRQSYLDSIEIRLTNEARLVGNYALQILTGDEPQTFLDTQAKEWSQAIDARVTIVGMDGTVLGESHQDRTQMENHASQPEIVQARLTGQGSSTRFSETIGTNMMYVAVPIKSEGEILAFARLALPLDEVQASISYLQRTLIIATLVISLLATLLAIWISNRTTNPLRDLIQAVNQIAAGHLESRLIPTTQDEIGKLTHTFNEMAIQLSAQIAALNAERSRIVAVLSMMTDGVIIVDTENRVQLINPAALAMFNITEQGTLGHTLLEVVRHYQVDELLGLCRRTGKSQTNSLEIAPQRLYLQVTATPLGKALPGNTLLLFQNLTRLRRLETIRQDFISNISHELRTPLASLKALTETLQESALEDPPAARRFLQQMETEVDAITHIVGELLELSRIESGRVPLKMAPTSPKELITNALERLFLQAERAGLETRIECPADLPKVLADSGRMEQVIVNLLHNAIKFTPAGGVIILSAQLNENRVKFSVQDNGIGIPADDLPRIFERFFKTDRARSSGGTGLGLAIARHLVEAHGGRIWAHSVEGQGSTFYFTIPVAD